MAEGLVLLARLYAVRPLDRCEFDLPALVVNVVGAACAASSPPPTRPSA